MHSREHWFALMDGRQVRLIRAGFTRGGRWHADEIDRLENQWEGDHQMGRPKMLANVAGRGGSPTHAASTQTEAEARKRFMRDASEWIKERLKEHGIGSLNVFAATKALGEWRQLRPDSLGNRLNEVECDLCSVPTSDLVDEARVREVLEGK